MIPHTSIINALRRTLGFKFHSASERVERYRKPGTTLIMEIHKRDLHHEQTARSLLRRAGMTHADIECFIASENVSSH